MASFWSLFLLSAYGILGGFVYFAKNILGKLGVDTTPWMRQVPVVGDFGPGMLAALILLLIVGVVLYRFLNRPRAVDFLIETETEMRKVVWPSWKETRSGAVAVIVTVTVMLLFLWIVDWFFLEAFKRLFQINLGG